MSTKSIHYFKSSIDGKPRNYPSEIIELHKKIQKGEDIGNLWSDYVNKQRSTTTDDYYRLIHDVKQMRTLLKGQKAINFETFNSNVNKINAKIFEGWTDSLFIYRALNIPEGVTNNKLPKYRFSYPDSKRGLDIKRGRANIEGSPIFYGCSDLTGSILEIIKTESDSNLNFIPEIVYVGQWRVIDDKKTFKFLDLNEKIHDNINFISTEELSILNMYFKHVSLCFRSKNGYDFSSQFANKYVKDERGKEINKISLAEILRYSSFIENGKYENFAIVPECINKKFYLDRVYKIKIPKFLNKSDVNYDLQMTLLEIGGLKNISDEEEVKFSIPPQSYINYWMRNFNSTKNG